MSSHGATRQSFHFQFITTPTSDTPGTVLYLHFNDQRYLFGRISEGTQRACIQQKASMARVHNIFMTGRESWKANGGLLGLMLTMADIQLEKSESNGYKRPRLHLHGGPRLAHNIACSRRFIFRTGMPLTVHETSPAQDRPTSEPSWSDDNIQVWAIPVRPIAKSKSEQAAPYESEYSSAPDEDACKNSSIPGLSDDEDARMAREAIVQDMFDSDWKRDRLVEAPLGEVNLPALIWIRDPSTKALIPHRCENISSLPEVPPDTKVFVRNPWPASLVGSLPTRPREKDVAMSYIVKGYPQRGRFDPEKAKELGVPMGPAWAGLTKGSNFQFDNGKIITPNMVLGPGKPGRGIAIMDIPNRRYIQSLLQRPEWENTEILSGIEAIVWILGHGVVYDSTFQDFVKSRPHVKHIISSRDTCPNYLAYESSAASSIRLSRIWPKVFPVPVHDNLRVPQSGGNQLPQLNYFAAKRNLKIGVEPRFEIQEGEVAPFLNTGDVIRDIPANVLGLAQQARTTWNSNDYFDQEDPEILFLGTGSAAPSKYRNVAGILLRLPGRGSYLFDCGENTLGQLSRVYDEPQLDEVLLDLKMIWISHLHADHHLGTLSISQARRAAWLRSMNKNAKRNSLSLSPMFVVGEEHLAGFHDDYGVSTTETFRVVASPIGGLQYNGSLFSFQDFGIAIKEFKTCFVSHCHGAQAVSVTFDNGFKFSYSGDCRPSEQFARIGARSDVLVHEATFDDGLEGDAMAKKHCTTGEALAVAAMMGAKNVILTHFSQRYQKIPVLSDVKLPKFIRFEEGDITVTDNGGPVDEAIDIMPSHVEARDLGGHEPSDVKFSDAFRSQNIRAEDLPPLDMNVCVAFDYMKIKVSQIAHMHKFTPALQALFQVEEDAEKTTAVGESAGRELYENANRNKSKGNNEVDNRGMETVGAVTTKSKKQMKREANRPRHEQEILEKGTGKKARTSREITASQIAEVSQQPVTQTGAI